MKIRGAIAVAFAVLVAGAMASFILTTVAMDVLPDGVMTGVAALVSFITVTAGGGWRAFAEFRTLERPTVALSLAGGALTFWAAPLLALTQRGTSAESGADTLFFTTVLWGVLVILGAQLVSTERTAITGVAGAVCAAAGAAGLLGSWEYPSSFSPFSKFPVREALMLVAGAMFVAGVLSLSQAARSVGVRAALTLGLGSAAVLGMLACIPGLPALTSAGASALRPVVLLGVADAVFAGALLWTARNVGVARASVPLLLVPVSMTTIAAYEQATAVYGVNPFEMRGVVSGSVVVVTGAVVAWLSKVNHCDDAQARGTLPKVAWWSALASCALAAASLVTPALKAVSEGHLDKPFFATWTMLGFESAAGWVAVAGALLALSAAFEALRCGATRAWLVAAFAVLVCALATPFLSATTLHTWNTWIPAEVQQTYGTEYARFSVSAIVDPVRIGSLVLAVVSASALALYAVKGAANRRSQEEGSQ